MTLANLSRRATLGWLAAAACWPTARADDGVVVVGHPSLPAIDAVALQRLYTGRAVEVGGQAVHVVNLGVGVAARVRFLERVVQLDEERYRAYWTVRRHIGKGAPPRELRSTAEVLECVATTAGCVGYIPASELRQGTHVLGRY